MQRHFDDVVMGRSSDVTLNAAWRGGGHLIVGGDVTRTDARLASGAFTAVQTSGRVDDKNVTARNDRMDSSG